MRSKIHILIVGFANGALCDSTPVPINHRTTGARSRQGSLPVKKTFITRCKFPNGLLNKRLNFKTMYHRPSAPEESCLCHTDTHTHVDTNGWGDAARACTASATVHKRKSRFANRASAIACFRSALFWASWPENFCITMAATTV